MYRGYVKTISWNVLHSMSRFSKRNQTEEIIVSIGNGTTTCRSCKEEFYQRVERRIYWTILIQVKRSFGSVYESYSGDRLDNFPPLGWKEEKKKNNKSEGGGGWDYFFFFFIREKLFRKTADSKIWIKLKKKILKERNFSISKYCFQIDTILFNVCYVNGKIIFIIYSRIRYKQNIYFLIYWGTMFLFFFFKYWKWIFYNFLYAFIYCIVIMLKLNILAISWNKIKRLRANSRNRNRYESWYKNMDRDLFLINDY